MASLSIYLPIFLLISSENIDYMQACMATSPGNGAVVTTTSVPTTASTTSSTSTTTSTTTTTTTTTTPPPLNTCSTDLITFGMGDNNTPELLVDVTFSGLSSTQIGNTLETTSTLTVSCTAIDGYNVFMQFNGGQAGPQENSSFPQKIDITLTCDSSEQVWNYVVTLNGVTYTRAITSVTCQQANNAG